MTNEIGEEHHGAIEQRDDDEVAPGEILLQLARELAHAPRDLFLGDEDALDLREQWAGNDLTTWRPGDLATSARSPCLLVSLSPCLHQHWIKCASSPRGTSRRSRNPGAESSPHSFSRKR